MGNFHKHKSADNDYNLNSKAIDIPFRSSLLSSYRFETPIWKNDDNYSIFKVYHLKNKIPLVKKKMRITPQNTRKVCQELDILLFLDHPNIIKVYEYFQTTTHYYIDYHYFQGSSIIDYYLAKDGGVDIMEIKSIIRTILATVNYLHSNNIVMRNFDPKNILYNGKEIIFVGFGEAMLYKGKSLCKKRKFAFNYSSPLYKAPEVINRVYDEKADIWVIGVILYLFLVNELPYKSENEDSLNRAILSEPINDAVLMATGIDSQAIDLIKGLLEKDPNKRLSAKEALNNPWLVKEDLNIETKSLKNILNKVKYISENIDFCDEIMKFVMRKSFQDKEFSELKKLFKQIDINDDGMITKEEFMLYLKTANYIIPDENIDTIFSTYDINKTGTLELDEFTAALANREHCLNEAKLSEYYNFIAKSDSNKLTYEELERLIGSKADKVELKKLYNKHSGRDRVLNKDEFISFMNEYISLLQKTNLKVRK